MTVWPLVEAAAATGQVAPVIGALYATAAGVGTNLMANQLEKWKDQADPPTEEEVATWVQQNVTENAEPRQGLDALIEKLEVIPQARAALPELYQRGVFNADKVVTVNDGAEWIQSFTDYHIPQATRILDFRHALDHLFDAGQVVFGEGTDPFRQWATTMAHQLKHKPPQHTIADLCLLRSQANSEEQAAAIDKERRYWQKREEMIDYPHFQNKGYSIGSGSVESSHKVVVHSRMKQAGMRWADQRGLALELIPINKNPAHPSNRNNFTTRPLFCYDSVENRRQHSIYNSNS